MWRYLTRRSVVGVVLLGLFTGGIYFLLWYVNTKDELNRAGARIPTAWLILVPIANFFWLWEWAGGIALVTRNRDAQIQHFVLMVLVPWVGIGLTQAALNRAIDDNKPAELPEARVVAG